MRNKILDKTMKILLIHPYLEIFDRCYAQHKAISERIKEFHVAFCSGEPKEEWKSHFIFHKFMDYPYKPKEVGWKKNLMRLPFHVQRLLMSSKMILEVNADVDLTYVLSSFWQQVLASRFARKHKIPCVARVRGHLQYELKVKESFLTRTFYSSMLRKEFRRSNMVIPITERVRRDLVYFGVPPAIMSKPVGLGVDCKHFFPKRRCARPLTVGYAGRLSEEKGIHRLIPLAQWFPNVKFLLAGRKQTTLTFPKNVTYLGRIPHEDMNTFYNFIDVLVLPSLTEGLPNVLLEAYASGTPVLVTPTAIPSELKIFGLKSSIWDFPLALKSLLNLDLIEIGAQARTYVKKNFTWKQFGRRMVKCFTRLM